MFLVDKYKVKNNIDVFFHKKIYEKNIIGYKLLHKLPIIHKNNIIELTTEKFKEIINKRNDLYNYYSQLPNLFVHGTSGVGKHTLVNMLLYDIFDINIIDQTIKQTYQIKGYGNSIVDVEIEQSQYHIIIDSSNSGFDKYLIQEVVKEYAKKKLMNIYDYNFPFKIIIINNIDNLSYYAQTALRCTMEKYYNVCRFILIGNQMSKLIEPIRSRCLCIRIPIPLLKESLMFLNHLNMIENKKLSGNRIYKIAKAANGNIKKIIWYFEMSTLGIKNYNFFWQNAITIIINIIDNIVSHSRITYNNISLMRQSLYKIFTTNINGVDILKEIIKQLIFLNKHDQLILLKIISTSSIYEGRINRGKRTMIHIECFINYIIQELWHNKNNKNKPIKITFDNICMV